MVLTPPQNVEAKLRDYAARIAHANQRFNLVGKTSETEIYEELILDCVPAIEYLPTNATILDIGSGAGLPGVVWAICRRDLKITLLESRDKRFRFLRSVAHTLHVDFEVISGRSDDPTFITAHASAFDVVTAKAVFAPDKLLNEATPLIKVGGLVVTFANDQASIEQATAAVSDRWDATTISYTTAQNEQRWLGLTKRIS